MNTNLQALTEAIAKRRPALIRTRRTEGNQTFTICFLSEVRKGSEEGIWAELVGGDPKCVDKLVAQLAMVDVYFETGDTRVYFESAILRRQKNLLRGERVFLSWPTALRIQEKRSGRREKVVPEVPVKARVKMGPVEVRLPVCDVSLTGVGLLWPDEVQVPRFERGQMLEVCLIFGGREHQVAAEYRRLRRLPEGGTWVGVRFADEGPAATRLFEQLHPLLEELGHRRILNTLGQTLGMFAA